jgi:hypothetical protein
MSLIAYTNSPGYHTRSNLVTGWQSGKYYDQDIIQEVVYQVPVVDAYAEKPFATRSDGHRPTNWYRTIGQVLTNNPSQKRRLVHVGNGSERRVIVDLTHDDHITNHYVPFSYHVTLSADDEARNKSLTKAKLKLKPNQSGWGENLAQGKKTCEDYSKLVGNFARLLLAAKRGNFREVAQRLGGGRGSVTKDIASLWLQYQYVVKPTVKDIYDLDQTVRDILKEPRPITAVATAFSEQYEEFTYGSLEVEGYAKSSFRTQLNGIMNNTNDYLLDSIGLSNPLDLAWELIPYSFVIDWFVPVGATLQAMTAGYGLQDNGGWTSNRVDEILKIRQHVDFSGDEDQYGVSEPGLFVEQRYKFDRHCYTNWPTWTGFYTAPNPFSNVHALNALALLRQLV